MLLDLRRRLLPSARPPYCLTPPARRAAQPSCADDGEFTVFGDLQVRGVLASRLLAENFKVATPIQAAAMMPIHRGEHAVLHAETGSGKTLAYLLPLLNRLHHSRPNQLLVVVPSRELALQIGAIVEQLWPWHGTRRVAVLSGSVSAEAQYEQLQELAAERPTHVRLDALGELLLREHRAG